MVETTKQLSREHEIFKRRIDLGYRRYLVGEMILLSQRMYDVNFDPEKSDLSVNNIQLALQLWDIERPVPIGLANSYARRLDRGIVGFTRYMSPMVFRRSFSDPREIILELATLFNYALETGVIEDLNCDNFKPIELSDIELVENDLNCINLAEVRIQEESDELQEPSVPSESKI